MKQVRFKPKMLVMGFILLFAPFANAGLMLTLMADGDTVTVDDATDISPNDDFVNFMGSVGDWNINMSTGLGTGQLGAAGFDRFHLNSLNMYGGTGPSTITILLTQTDLTMAPAQWVAKVGGVTSGSIEFSAYIDPANLGGTGNLLASTSVGVSPFSFTQGGTLPGVAGPYSMTIAAAITHSAGRTASSFDYEMTIPEPSSITLLGLGVLGMGFAARRRKT